MESADDGSVELVLRRREDYRFLNSECVSIFIVTLQGNGDM